MDTPNGNESSGDPLPIHAHISEVTRLAPELFALTASPLVLQHAKDRCLSWGWRLTEYHPEDGIARIELWDGWELVMGTAQSGGIGGRSFVHIPIYYWEVSERGSRTDFDEAFTVARRAVANHLGHPLATGTYEHGHRPGWPYRYGVWRGGHAFFIVMQDEIDIQFGMDVSIWLLGRNEGELLPSFPLSE